MSERCVVNQGGQAAGSKLGVKACGLRFSCDLHLGEEGPLSLWWRPEALVSCLCITSFERNCDCQYLYVHNDLTTYSSEI